MERDDESSHSKFLEFDMYAKFPLFQNHLDFTKSFWKEIVKPGDVVIDATCGNGHDLLFLAQLALKSESGWIFGLDIQPESIKKTQELLAKNLSQAELQRIFLLLQSHATFPVIPQLAALVVYNLGYLPGGNKQITTKVNTTLQSLTNALSLLKAGGVISITCYPGHPEGALEEHEILLFCKGLDPKEWSVAQHRWVNRQSSPSVIMIQRAQ